MSLASYLTLAYRILLIGAVGFIFWYVRTASEDTVKLKDLKAVEKQIENNAVVVSRYAQELEDAEVKRSNDLAQLTATIGINRTPVRLCPATISPRTLPANPASPTGRPSTAGGPDEGSGVDLRPAINAFELKYEEALANCRLIQGSWPK